ncbi:metal-dependent hydrolase [Candidatus Woesearchaeota archaeon]|nr:metal-dependent hydrolase [Candidatus Woesearchaeota archaeon]
MMLYTHILAGVFVFTIVSEIVNPSANPGFISLAFMISIIAAIAPDFDMVFELVPRKLRIVKHRGITHTLLALIASSAIITIYNKLLAVYYSFGYGSHLLLDGVTKSGIKPFYPFKYKLRGPITTGGLSEIPVAAILIISVWILA